ncbi:MAG TPA: serine/threonine protein kinase, partial [Allocoleopsis sp.]
EEDIKQVFLETKSLLGDKSEDELLNLPPMNDVYKLAGMRILSVLFAPVFLAVPHVLPFIPCQQVFLSLQYGNNSHSALGYANYAIILNGFLQDIEESYKFGQLALKLLFQVNSPEIKGRTINQVAGFTMHGKAHLKDTFPLLLQAYQISLENGDLEFVGYSSMNRCQYLYLGGQELAFVEKEIENFCHVLQKLKLQTSLNYNQIFWQSVLNLISFESSPGVLIGKGCNENELLPMLLKAGDRYGLFSLYLHKAILCYLFDDYSSALINAIAAEKYIDGATGIASVPVFYFYDSLIRLAVYSSVPNDQQKSLILKVENNQEKMQRWANYAPMNYQHKFDLVEAEKARVLADYLQAIEYYDRAISGAKNNEYINEQGLGNELAAQFYFNSGKEKFAHSYIQEAHYAYTRWGAMAKVKQLEQKYPILLTLTLKSIIPPIKSTRTTRTTTGMNAAITLDFATIMKANQAISGEIVL